jgi:hypothetical protein
VFVIVLGDGVVQLGDEQFTGLVDVLSLGYHLCADELERVGHNLAHLLHHALREGWSNFAADVDLENIFMKQRKK